MWWMCGLQKVRPTGPYDLYCGTGSIGIYVSDGAKTIIGVEVVESAVQDTRENAEMNGIGHAQFFYR